MKSEKSEFRSTLTATPKDVYLWHSQPRAFGRLTPPWEKVRIVERQGGIEPGSTAVIATRLLGPIQGTWTARHEALTDLAEGEFGFADRQLKGPFAHWRHQHRFAPVQGNPDSTELKDQIEWVAPLGILGKWFGAPIVRRKLDQMFAYRHEITVRDFERMQTLPPAPDRIGPIAITGASGLVGGALVDFLDTQGYEVWSAGRSEISSFHKNNPGKGGTIQWKPDEGGLPLPDSASPLGAVVHLAGANIAEGRWSSARKKVLEESRVLATRKLCENLASLKHPPHTLICASATGYYGSTDEESDLELDESSPPGQGFLPQLAQDWELAAKPAVEAGIRVIHLRFGVVVSGKGGALGKMLPVFKMGAGGRLGSGRQWMSWIAMDDLLDMIHWTLTHETLSGAFNAVAPHPVRNNDWTRILGTILKRPTLIPAPAFAMKLALGEMADAILLTGARIAPRRAMQAGFTFRYPDLESALRKELGKFRDTQI